MFISIKGNKRNEKYILPKFPFFDPSEFQMGFKIFHLN